MAQSLVEYGAGEEHLRVISVEMLCICCLAQDVPLIHLVTCKHKSFLEIYCKYKMDIQDCLICHMCHGLLRKIDLFVQQISRSLNVMNEKVSHNHIQYYQTTQVKLLSVDPDEDGLSQEGSGSKEYQEIGVRDDLDMEQFVQRNDVDGSDMNGLEAISNVCQLETQNSNLSPKENKQDITSDTIKLEQNTTELNIICPEEFCQHPDGYHAHYDNHNEHDQYNDNDAYDTNRYDEYFENGTKPQDINNYDTQIYNDNTNNDNESDVKNENKTEEKKKKKGKKLKSGFKKIILSLEEQKAELEAKRKTKKYLDAEFKCYNCALGFLFKDTYQAHMMRHEESNGEYKCPTCTLRFASPAVLRAHAQYHGVRVRCRRCDAHAHARHARAHACNARDTAPCHLCARVFKDASGLQQHIKRFHQSKNSLRSYSCSVCGKSYNNQAAVRTHMIKHLNRKFTCDRCTATFSSPYTLNQHKKKHDAPPEQHYCEICKIAYSSRKSLLAHRRNALVHQQTVYECPVCSRVCANQRSLSSHMVTVHSTSKDHVCECGARYTSRKSLVRHRASHNTVAREVHACHRCPSTFKSRSKLNRHLRQVCEKDKLEEELSCYYEQPI